MNKKKQPVQGVSLVSMINKNSTLAEECRIIRSNIQFSAVDREMKSIAITSSSMNEGKSTVAANLAVLFADSGKKTLLVDGDLRRPTVALTFKQSNHIGLSTLLTDMNGSIHDVVRDSNIPELSILTAGPKPPNPSEMLNSNRMLEVMETLEEMFDLIIYDLPPISNITDAQIVAARTNGTVLVSRQQQTKKSEFLKAVNSLKMAKANVIGVVYNGMKKNSDSYYYYG